MIFLLMAFLFIGTSQARSEASCIKANAALHSWIIPTTSSDMLVGPPNDTVSIAVNVVGPTHACQNDVVTLTAQFGNEDLTGVSFQWRRNGNYIVGATSPSYSFNVASLPGLTDTLVYEFDVEIIRNGCENIYSPVHYFSVSPTPVVEVSAPLFCAGSPVTMTANSYTSGDETPYMWKWIKNNSTDTITTYVNNLTVNNAENGDVYNVFPIYQDFACNAVAGEVTLTTFESNFVNQDALTISLAAIQNTVCLGSQNTLTITDNNNAYGDATYVWYKNGQLIPDVTGTEYVVNMNEAGSHTFKVVATYSNYPCENPESEINVTVYANPTVEITGDPLICSDSLITLYANINDTANTGGNYTYDWRIYNYSTVTTDTEEYGVVENNSPILQAYFPAQDHPYIFQVVVTNENGCVSTSERYNVYVEDTIFVAVTLDYDRVCRGGEVTATAHLGNYNTENLVYQWYKNGTLISHATEPTFTTDITEATELRVVVRQTTTGCVAVGFDTATVINPTVVTSVVAINGNNSGSVVEVCEGAQITVIAYTEDGTVDSSLTYVWKENGHIMPQVNGYQFSKQVWILDDDSANYTYEAYIDYQVPGCYTSPVASNTVHVKRNPMVTIGGVHNVCFQGVNTPNIHLTAWVDGEYDTNAVYRWYRNGALTNNYQAYDNYFNEMRHPTNDDPVTYVVEVINGDGCSAFSEPFEVNVYAKPVVNILASETHICNGGEVELQARIDNYNDPMLTIQWYESELNNSHLMPGRTHENETFTLTQTTRFYAHVKHLLSENTSEHSICDAYDSLTVFVVADPTLVVTNNLEGEDTICDGRSVTFNATIDGGVAGGEVYTWYRNGEIIPGAVAATFTETVHAENNYPTTYVYTVSVKQTASDCESDVYAAGTFTVNPNPTIEITTDPIVCINEGGNIRMIANVNPAPETNYSFNWFEENVALTDATTGEHNDTIVLSRPYRDYPYNFSVSLVNEYGCQAVAEAQVYVDDNPVVNITATETEICEGGEITLTANLNNWNTPNMLYQWYDNGTAIAGATSLTYTVVPELGNHEYSFTATQLNSLCNATSGTIIVTVNEIPEVLVYNELEDITGSICDGRSVTFTASTPNGVPGGEVYTWYRNGEIIPNAVGAIFTETVHAENNYPTEYTYAVSVRQTASGCESDVYPAGTFTVNPNPTVEIATDPIVCSNTEGNIIMTANVNPAPETDYSFTWFEDNAAIAETDIVSVSEIGNVIVLTKEYRDYPYNFSVSLVNEYGCQAVAEAQVYVDDNPVVNITATETEICVGGEITLTANLNNWNTPNMQYQWSDNGVEIEGATSLTYTVVPTQGTHVYTFEATQLNSLCTATSNEVTVTVNADPVIASVTLSDEVVCQGAQIAITANADNYEPSADDVYTWYRNGILIPGATAQTIYDSPVTVDNNTQQYIYTAVVTRTPAGCTSLPVASAALTVYPNPTVVISGDQHVCETESIYLIANVDTIGANVGTLHYTWYESGMVRDNMAYSFGDSQFYGEYWYARTEPYRFVVEVQREGVPAACASRSAEFLVYVYPQPVVNITATETEICENGEVTLTANLVDANAENMVYQWYEVKTRVDSFASGYDPATNQYTYTYNTVEYRDYISGANSITYTTTYTHTSRMGVEVLQTPSECTAYNEIIITVNPIPVVTAVTVNGLALETVCNGAQVNLAATIEPADAQGAVYTWFRNGVEIPGANQSTFSENVYTIDNQQTTNVYTAMVTLPASGCISNVSTPHADVVINPAPSTVSISGINVICEDDFTTLTVYSDVEGTITWSTGANTESITVPAGSYTATVTTPEGCEMTSENFVVTALGTDLFVTASETAICEGEHTTLYASQDGWSGNVTYLWDDQANNSTATTVDVQPAVTTTYQVTANVNSTNGSCQAVGNITIVVTPRPAQVNVTASASEICEGEQVTFYADGEAYAYIWYQNGVEIPGENQATLTVNFPIEGSYTFAAKAINDQNCESAEASEPVTVTVNAAPDQVVVSGNLVICDNGSTTLYANVTPNVAEASYQWYMNNVAIEGATNDYLVVTEAGSYKVDVTTNGCTTVSNTVNVTVQEAPQLQLTATEESICQNGSTVITAEATGWSNENVNYNWSCAQLGNSFSYQGSVFTFTPTVAGDYTFSVTASQSTSGCVAVDNITIHVDVAPAAPVLTVDNPVVCEGAQITLTLTDTNTVDYGTPTIAWFDNGAALEGAQNTLTIVPSLGEHAYTASVTYPFSGCNTAYSAPLNVTVLPAPEVVVVTTGNTTICEGGSTTFTANVTPAGNYNYQWFVDNVEIAGANEASYTVTDAIARETAYNYSVVVTSYPGCQVEEAAPALTVVADPVVVASVDNSIICEGGVATFSVTVDGGVANVNGMNGYTYAWYANTDHANPIATTPTFTLEGAVAGQYAYEVVVTSPYGCETTSNVVNFSVVNDPVVTVAVAAGYPSTICEGGSTMLIANVEGGYGSASYQWYKNGVILNGETNATLLVTEATDNNSVYTVVVAQTGVDCIANSTATSTVNPFTVVPAYTVTIEGNANTCPGGSVTLTAAINNLVAGDVPTYQWYRNGVAINGATEATYTTPALLLGDSYDYNVVVTSAISGCSVVSGSVTANVVAAPTVEIVGANAVCENGQLPLHAYVNGGVAGDPYTYTWNWTGATTGTATTATETYVPSLPANDGANPYFFTVTITRNDNTGCEATSAPFQLNVYPAPAVVVTANRDMVCEGGNVTFTANVTPAGNYNYAWTINGVANATNAPVVTTALNNAGDVTATVVVSANNAIASCATTATLAVPVQVVAAPVVTIAANHTTMCAGGTTELSIANISNNGIPANYSYQWAINGFEVEGAINSTFVQNLNTAGTYNYTLRLTQNSELGCVSEWSAPVTVLVAEQPQVALSNADGLDICVGGTVTLNGTVMNYGNTVNGVLNSSVYGPMTFTWTANGTTTQVNDNVTAATNQLAETINTVGNYEYSVLVTPSGYACQPAQSNNVVVGVVNNPTWVDVHVYYPDVCVGQQVDLVANINGGVFDNAGNTNGYIQWTVTANGITANVSGGLGGTSYDIPTFAGNYVYTPTYVGNMGSGCQLDNTAEVEQPVIVHALPTAEFISVDGQTICANDPDASVELIIAFTGGAPYYFDLYNENTNTSNQYVSLTDTFSLYVAPTMTTVYRIINLHNEWCDNNNLTAAAQTVVNVIAVEFAETTFRPVNCGDDVIVNFTITSGNQNEAYQIFENGVQIAAGTVAANSVIIPDGLLSEGTHQLTLVIGDCSFDITVIIPVDAESSELFGANLMEQRWDDVAIINMNANSRYQFVGFQWYRNNELIPGAIYKNYQEVGGLNGFYSVEITAIDTETGAMVTFITCPREFNTTSSLKVYPVPANIQQEVTIELDLTAEELNGAVLDIYDATGKLVSHMTDLTPITRVAGFKAQGTYFGRIVTGTNEIKTVKFVIVK